MDTRSRLVGGLLGAIVGDALGVPFEFEPRSARRSAPATDLVGWGTHHQPPGTWSDDTSMLLCTVESILARGHDPDDLMERFRRWALEGHLTPHGKVFDIGGTCQGAVFDYAKGKPALACGRTSESSNGNGALMRILPVALAWRDDRDEELLRKIAEVGALTHGTLRSKLCCACYCLVARGLLRGLDVGAALSEAAAGLEGLVPPAEREVLAPVLTGDVLRWPEERISSGGYVVHTLEAALWCLEHGATFRSAVLLAVNLGDDTDTTAAVAGGLAGVRSGREGIPADWIAALARRDDVLDLVERFAGTAEAVGSGAHAGGRVIPSGSPRKR